MTIMDLISELQVGGVAAIIIAALTLVQLSPLKWDPWDRIFSWLGQKLNGKELKALRQQVEDLWVNSHRQCILSFARECRNGIEHSSDEWATVLTVVDEYQLFCTKHSIANGVVKAASQYIQALYQDLSRNGGL